MIKKIISLILSSLTLFSCSSAPKSLIGPKDIPTNDYSIIFGSISDYGLFGKHLVLSNSSSDKKIEINGIRGLFILKIKPGDYIISARGIHGGSSMPCDKKSAVTIQVPSNSLVYAGSTFSNLVSDQYYYDLKTLNKNKIRNKFKYCKENEWSYGPMLGFSYDVYTYDNFEMDYEKLLQAAPQFKSYKQLYRN